MTLQVRLRKLVICAVFNGLTGFISCVECIFGHETNQYDQVTRLRNCVTIKVQISFPFRSVMRLSTIVFGLRVDDLRLCAAEWIADEWCALEWCADVPNKTTVWVTLGKHSFGTYTHICRSHFNTEKKNPFACRLLEGADYNSD